MRSTRPRYGGSTPNRNRRVAHAAADVAAIADHHGVERFARHGGWGGAPHALGALRSSRAEPLAPDPVAAECAAAEDP
jgi:hypothetical protein